MANSAIEERFDLLVKRIPWVTVIWLAVAAVLLLVGRNEISLRDEARFVADFQLQVEETDDPNTYILHVTDGEFEYQVNPRTIADVQPGTFTPGTPDAVAAYLFTNFEQLREITIEAQTISVTYEGDIDGNQLLRRVQRGLFQQLLNDPANITGVISDSAPDTLLFTTTDASFQYGEFVSTLVEEGESERYDSRDAGLNGSALAKHIFTNVPNINALTIEPDRLIVTVKDGTISTRLVLSVQDSLNDYYPRASMLMNLWAMTLESNNDHFVQITPVDTGIPLFWFALVFAGAEALLFYYWAQFDNKLVLALVRVGGIFFFFWSLFGHEPLWDYIMGQIFPNSRQVVHPSADVVEFVAQHLELVIISSLVTIPAGLFIGILVTRDSFREVLPLANNLVNSGQTVPTIAIVAFMAPIIGFGFWPAIIALIAYGLLPVVRNTIAGLQAVDASIIDSARGMGMTPIQILLQTELPIASSIIMAGVRTSMVVNVGTATLGAFVGSGGLGTPIASGLAMTIDAFVLLGALPAAVLAILVDYILGQIEFVITPKGLQIDT